MTYNSKQNNEISEVIFKGVKAIMRRRTTPWQGTMTDLFITIEDRRKMGSIPANWPGSASALRVALNKVVNRLRNAGIGVRFTRSTNHARTRLVEFIAR
jgi:hypothetical protein